MQHGFNVDYARQFGVEEAILIHSFQFWIDHNRANGQHFHDGRTWSYNTLQAFAKQFPYWTTKQVRRAVDSLVRKGVLLKGNYGTEEGWSVFNRTVWYAFADEATFLITLPAEEEGDSICPNGQMDMPQMDLPKRANLRDAQMGKSDLPIWANESKEAVNTPLGTACEVQQAGIARTCTRAREGPDPTACLPANLTTNGPTGTGTDAPRPVSEGAALLLRSVAEGGAGFDSIEAAEKAARGREPLLLQHWIRQAKKRGASSVAGFIIAAFKRGDAPPESYLKAVKASFQQGGGILDGLGAAVGIPAVRDKVRQVSGPPAWEVAEPDDDEEPEERPKPAPRRAEPRPPYFDKWRGHGR